MYERGQSINKPPGVENKERKVSSLTYPRGSIVNRTRGFGLKAIPSVVLDRQIDGLSPYGQINRMNE